MELLFDIGLAIIAATVLGLLAHYLRQPILLGYLLAGVLVGHELGFGVVHGGESIPIISEIGLVLLLFVIGLELNLKEVLASGRQMLVVGLGQFPASLLLGAAVFGALGYGLTGTTADGLYLAIACGLSSTAIIVKLLYDKGELDTLPGRLTLGITVIQDIYAILVLAFQPNFTEPAAWPLLKALLATVTLIVSGFLVSRFVLKRVFLSIAKTPEMVLAVSLGWCAAMATAGAYLNLSKEMGALIAGLSIAAFPYSVHVTAKTLPLRDFFLTLFFVALGMKITAPSWDMVLPLLGVIVFVLASRLLTVFPLIVWTGGGRRAGFVASLNTVPVSEFSLVIASLGLSYGHIREETVNLLVYVMAVLAVGSSYLIRLSHPLYRFVAQRCGWRDADPVAHHEPATHDVVLLGCHRTARALVDALAQRDPRTLSRLLVIDFNPVMIQELQARGVATLFGDISSMDTLTKAGLDRAACVISTIPDMLLKGVDNEALMKMCRSAAPQATLIATADDQTHARRLIEQGATRTLQPHNLAGDHLASLLTALPSGRSVES